MERKHLNIKISGQVQGVFFRETAKDTAEKLGIFGFVRNESDGTVYIEAEGDEVNLDKFIKWCHDGSEAAQIDKVEVQMGSLKNFSKFSRDFADY